MEWVSGLADAKIIMGVDPADGKIIMESLSRGRAKCDASLPPT